VTAQAKCISARRRPPQAEEVAKRADELKKAQHAQAAELARREMALAEAQEQLEHHTRALQQVSDRLSADVRPQRCGRQVASLEWANPCHRPSAVG
jgi:hypothetical protein